MNIYDLLNNLEEKNCNKKIIVIENDKGYKFKNKDYALSDIMYYDLLISTDNYNIKYYDDELIIIVGGYNGI